MEAHVGAVAEVNPESNLMEVFAVPAVDKCRASFVESALCSTLRAVTLSVSVPDVAVEVLRIHATVPFSVKFAEALSVIDCLSINNVCAVSVTVVAQVW